MTKKSTMHLVRECYASYRVSIMCHVDIHISWSTQRDSKESLKRVTPESRVHMSIKEYYVRGYYISCGYTHIDTHI